MGGTTSQQTASTTATPFPAAVPGYTWGAQQATNLAQRGQLVRPNTMSTVVPYAQQTMQGMNAIQGNANAGMAPGGYASQFGDILKSGGYNAPQSEALAGLRGTANGAYDMNANPGFGDVLKQIQDSTRGAVNQNFSGLGRTGAGSHEGAVAKQIGDVTSSTIMGDYNNWLGRRDAATRDVFNMGQQGQGNLENAFARQNDPANALMGIGGQYEDLYGRQLNDTLRRSNEDQNKQLANIQALNSVLGGAGNFGTTTQTAQMPSNTLSNIAGAGLGGASLLSGGGKL